ncbi:MAG: diguanylate cyclase [Chloroflexi bacterium]|nr:diguanylate cyclase [Chloroflexota bacterium]
MSTGRPVESTPGDLARAVRGAEARLLATLAEVLATTDEADAALERLLELAAGLLDGAVAAIAVAEPDSGVLVGGPSRGFDGRPIVDEPLAVAGSTDALAIAARESRVVAIPSAHVSPAAARLGIGTGLVLPLVVRRDAADLTVGALLVAHADGRVPTDDETRLAAAIAAIAAAIVERSLLTDAARARAEWRERLAQVDPLTGLANRRALERIGELEVARAIRQETALAVVVVDVDGFDAQAAAAGRQAADAVLREVAVAVAEGVRLVDTVARLGPAEFVVLAPGSGGETVARRIAGAVATLAPVGDWKVRVSTGVAHVPGDGTTLRDLVDAATRTIEAARAAAG